MVCADKAQTAFRLPDSEANAAAVPIQDVYRALAGAQGRNELIFNDVLAALEAGCSTLFLTMPIAWRGTLAQYAGRLHRLHDPKREVVIYDYIDRDVPVLARMAAKRAAGYSAIGYTIAQGPELFDGQLGVRSS